MVHCLDMYNTIWISNSGPSQQCSNIVFNIIGDHVVIFAHTRDQRMLTFTGRFDIYTCTVVFNQLSLVQFLWLY